MSMASSSGGYGSGPVARAAGRPFTPTVGVGEGPSSLGGAAGAGVTAVFVMAVSSIALLQGVESQRVMLTACLSLILFSLISFAPSVGIVASLVYLAFVGGLKRALIPVLGYTPLDPLLMVVPIVVFLSFMNRIIQRQVPRDTHLDKIILAFVCFMAIQILNPLQGGLVVGMAGALFYIVPVMWYYIGRRTSSERLLREMFTAFVIIALIGAVYGLYQTWFGFSDTEKQWLKLTGNENGLHLAAATRVFSFFSSFAEYCHILIIACLICMASVIKKNRLAIIPAIFLFICVVLSSSRGSVLGVLFGTTTMWAVQGGKVRTWIPRLIVSAILGAAAIGFGIGQVANIKTDAVTSDLLQHQTRGLSDPLNNKKSTGGSHLSLVWGGISAGFRNPLGNGLGSTTLAAGKFSSESAGGTESDFGNMFVSLGLLGGGLYIYIVYYTLRKVLTIWQKTRSYVALVILGVFLAELGLWMFSGHYMTTMVIWFCIGWLGRVELMEKIKADTVKPPRFLPRGRRFPIAPPVEPLMPASTTTNTIPT